MEKPIAVIAFGGNAILDKGDDGSFETQLEKAKTACREMLSILHKGYDICLVHGNGPQVGNLLIQFEKARDIIPVPPLDVAVASSQGLLGHMLEVSMRSVLAEDNMEKDVACILTQVVVDSEDPSFKNPTKPIGPFFTKKDAECLMEKQGCEFPAVKRPDIYIAPRHIHRSHGRKGRAKGRTVLLRPAQRGIFGNHRP